LNSHIKIGMNKKRDSLSSEIYKSSSAKYNKANIKSNYIFMYNRDQTILYYYIINVKEFLDNLNIHWVTFQKHLENGTYYLGKYTFTREFVSVAKFKNMSMSELALMLNKDRVKFKRKKKD
jgi:hypothetical protein